MPDEMSRRITRSVIPNLFTALNMFSGFLSIVNASEKRFIYAAWLIIIAGIFDALDGLVARLTKSSSELGVELDSLSDIISFGAAPSYLMYATYLRNLSDWGIIISSLPLIAGGFRLARFNVQLVGFDKEYFKGLPIPSSAITLAAFVLAYFEPSSGYMQPLQSFIIPLIILLSFLMVSTIRYDTIPKPTGKEIKTKPLHFLFILITIIALILSSGKALIYIFVFIILFGIFRHIYMKFFKSSTNV
jgi:CDP-diacylglycerol---serine O-phosphatidyltransferase